MIGFVFNPPGHRRVSRRRGNPRRVVRRKTSRGAMAWKRSVKKFGVRGAAERRMKRRAAARRARRTMAAKRAVKSASKPRARRIRRHKASRKAVVPMAKRRKVSRKRRAHKARGVRRVSRRRSAALKGWRKRRALKASKVGRKSPRRRRRSRKAHRRVRRTHRFTHRTGRRAARRAWRIKPGRRAMVKYSRKNVRRALNKVHGVRRWVKHSRAKWNPGMALSVGAVGSSITSVFKLENLYDGLAIGGGIIGALALPRLLDKVVPEGIKSRLPLGISLTSGWFSYVASAGSAGLLGYLAGVAFGRRYGEKVFWGGIGATLAKLVLDYVGPIRTLTGVQLSAYDNSLARAIEQEVAAELRAGGGMSAYVSPGDLSMARPLGDYASPEDIMGARALGGTDEFGEGDDFENG